jgi:hypothetical protein
LDGMKTTTALNIAAVALFVAALAKLYEIILK